MKAPTTAKIDVPHTDLGDDTYHQWIYLPVHKGEPMRTYRDSLGRRNGSNHMWLVLICNNTDCSGRILVNAEAVAALADGANS